MKKDRIQTLLLLFLIIVAPSNVLIEYSSILMAAIFLVSFLKVNASLFFIVIGVTNCFTMFANDGVVFSEWAWVATIAIWLRYLIDNRGQLKREVALGLVVFFLSVLFSGAIMANYNWGQPFFRSIIGLRQYIYISAVIPLKEEFKKYDRNYILEYISFLTSLVALLIVVQFILGDNFKFLSLFITERFGDRRALLHLATPVFLVAFGYNFKMLLDDYKDNFWSRLFNLIVIILAIFFVSKTRMFSLATIGMAALIYLLSGNYANKVIKAFVVITMLIAVAVGGYEYIMAHVSVVFSDIVSMGDDYGRIQAFTEYAKYLGKIPLLGSGIANKAFLGSPILLVEQKRLYLSDLGAFSDFFQFGIQGIIVYIVFLYAVINKSKKLGAEYRILCYSLALMIAIACLTVPLSQQLPVIFIMAVVVFRDETHETISGYSNFAQYMKSIL